MSTIMLPDYSPFKGVILVTHCIAKSILNGAGETGGVGLQAENRIGVVNRS